jgi:hypothetical protein
VNLSAPAAPIETTHETIDQLIRRVLSRAHRMLEAQDAPNEARTVLHVADAFADELSALDPGFDRLQFIKAVTEDQS